MGLFKKGNVVSDHTDVGVLGGVICWDHVGSNENLVWKYPSNKIRRGAKLQVHDTQEAALFIDGKCVRVFRGGGEAYTINESANIPLLGSVLNFATGGEPVYFAEVWFVNVKTVRKIAWFCDGRNGLKLRENNTVYSALLSCDCVLKISDTEKFLEYFVGKLNQHDSSDVENFFQSNLISATVSSVKQLFTEANIPFADFIGNREELQAKLEIKTNEAFMDEFGIQTSHFAVSEFSSPELDEFWAAQQKSRALSELGIDYTRERQLDILQSAAENEGGGAGVMMGAGVGLGAGMGMGNMMGGMMQNMPQAAPPPPIQPQLLYYFIVNGQQSGPCSFAQLQQYAQQGALQPSTMVWKNGMPAWAAANMVPELAPLFAPVTPPPPPLPVP